MKEDPLDRAKVIAEALPFIHRYRGKRVLVKIGGSALTDDGLLTAFARDVSLLTMVGIKIIVVHGGGPQIGQRLKEAGIAEKKARGIRVTDEATLEIVEQVLFGSVNKKIVDAISGSGVEAKGLNGKENHLIQAQRKKDPEVDYGLVGTVSTVNTSSVNSIKGDAVPVIAPLGADPQGRPLNINADESAAALAVALGCEALLMLTDTDGVQGEDGYELAEITAAAAEVMAKEGMISEGMLPKVECALAAVDGGVPSCRIMNGKKPHALLLELLTDQGAGTMIYAKLIS